jgi:hypothetical protein
MKYRNRTVWIPNHVWNWAAERYLQNLLEEEMAKAMKKDSEAPEKDTPEKGTPENNNTPTPTE